MFSRSLLLTILSTFACLTFITEGRRLFDPEVPPSNSNDVVAESSEPEPTKTSIAIDAASSKFSNFVGSSRNTSMCDHIDPDELPDECSCREPGPFSLVIECLKTFNSTYFNDTIGMKIDLDPCNEDGAKLSLDVTEREHDIDYTIVGVRAGESKNIPIPGLAMIVPGVGNVGLDVAVLIAGNPDTLRLKIGLNACAQLSTDHQVCASSIPGISSILPWYILKGTYSFGDVCSSNRDALHLDSSSSQDTNETPTILAE